jgi:hypothetical protein
MPSPQIPQHPHPHAQQHQQQQPHAVHPLLAQQQQNHPAVVQKLPPYTSGEVAVYLEQNQSMPWNLAPGGIDQFAHGTEEMLPLETGNLFWGSMAPGEGWGGPPTPVPAGMLTQHVGGYSY